jgi:diadenosine tetraphosphatase ApaH/serine/threonine PP2A family protein phosphatase
MDAIISDIHGNLEALLAVEEAICELGCERTICLGDVVGLGPDSLECARHSTAFDLVIAGCFDLATLEQNATRREHLSSDLNEMVESLRAEIYTAPDAVELFRILRSYRGTVWEDELCFAHGTPQDALQYIFPEAIYDEAKLNQFADRYGEMCLLGHTHIAGIFTRGSDFKWSYEEPTLGTQYSRDAGQKTIVNVGSVGQPRDGDPRACFVTIDEDCFQFHRVQYNIELTIAKIRDKKQ